MLSWTPPVGVPWGCAVSRGQVLPLAPVPAVSRPAGSGDKGARRRRGPGGGIQGSTQSGAREVRVESLQRVRTDFSPDALQKAVRFSADGALLATGGADGFLRLWEVGTGELGCTAGLGAAGSRGERGGAGAGTGSWGDMGEWMWAQWIAGPGWAGGAGAAATIAVPMAARVGQG